MTATASTRHRTTANGRTMMAAMTMTAGRSSEWVCVCFCAHVSYVSYVLVCVYRSMLVCVCICRQQPVDTLATCGSYADGDADAQLRWWSLAFGCVLYVCACQTWCCTTCLPFGHQLRVVVCIYDGGGSCRCSSISSVALGMRSGPRRCWRPYEIWSMIMDGTIEPDRRGLVRASSSTMWHRESGLCGRIMVLEFQSNASHSACMCTGFRQSVTDTGN